MTSLQNELLYYMFVMYFLAGFTLFLLFLAQRSMKKQLTNLLLKKIFIKLYILVIVFCVSLGAKLQDYNINKER